MLVRAFYYRAYTFAPVLQQKERFFHVFLVKNANFGIFEAKHLHERERSWC